MLGMAAYSEYNSRPRYHPGGHPAHTRPGSDSSFGTHTGSGGGSGGGGLTSWVKAHLYSSGGSSSTGGGRGGGSSGKGGAGSRAFLSEVLPLRVVLTAPLELALPRDGGGGGAVQVSGRQALTVCQLLQWD